jgi:hypothetical protein
MAHDRMFQVIVLGGVGLAGACGPTIVNPAATGSSVSGTGGTTATGMGGFPQNVGPATSSSGAGGFPQEGSVSSSGAGGFPQEGPQIPDAGPDAFADAAFDADAGFPMEGTPETCAELGVVCGLHGDGLGGLLNCGPCPPGETCGGSNGGTCIPQ